MSVTVLLFTPHRLAETETFPVCPEVVVPTPVLLIEGRMVVGEIVQVTFAVTSCVPVTLLNVALAAKVAVWPLVTVALLPLFTVITNV